MFGFRNMRNMAKTPRHGCHVNRRITAANNHDFPRRSQHITVVERIKKLDPIDAVFGAFPALNRQRAAVLCAQGPENRVKRFFQFFDLDVGTNPNACSHINAHGNDPTDFFVQHIARGAVSGDTKAHHAAQFVMCFKHRDAVTLTAQEIGR